MLAQPRKRVLLVSLPGLVQEATCATLVSFPDLVLVAITPGALSATQLLPQLRPDLLLVDVNLPEQEVQALLQWTRKRSPGLQRVVLAGTSHARDQALAWGADAAIQRADLVGQLQLVLRQISGNGWKEPSAKEETPLVDF
jgi:DNA-binding NarL/FixJ family response regulator